MKYLIIMVCLLMAAFASQAQDPTLPTEVSKIYLNSGKKIEKVSLWKIDSSKVEYTKGGNLADVNTMDVLRIESLNYRIEFDDHQKMILRMYDLIIVQYGDTIRGIIKKIEGNRVTYIPANKNNFPLMTVSYQSFIKRNNEPDVDSTEVSDKQESADTSKSDIKPHQYKKVKTELEEEKLKSLHNKLIAVAIALFLIRIISISMI